jgi:hypothetical protein
MVPADSVLGARLLSFYFKGASVALVGAGWDLGEPDREARVVVDRDHPAFLPERIIANFARLVITLIADSRFGAVLRLGWVSRQTSLVGRRLRV